MQRQLTAQERGTILEWLRHNRALQRPRLVVADAPQGRADRYYQRGPNVVAVEVTRVLIPSKQRRESDARLFLTSDIASLVAGRIPRRFFAFTYLPWQIPPKGDREATTVG